MKARIATGLILLALVGQAQAMTFFLVGQWMSGSSRMCKYANGVVISSGYDVCPMSIEG